MGPNTLCYKSAWSPASPFLRQLPRLLLHVLHGDPQHTQLYQSISKSIPTNNNNNSTINSKPTNNNNKSAINSKPTIVIINNTAAVTSSTEVATKKFTTAKTSSQAKEKMML